MSRLIAAIVCAMTFLGDAVPARQPSPSAGTEPLHRPLDEVLDLYVRDGYVYYRALRSERGRLDRYAASLNSSVGDYDRWTRERKMAFWINAYNVFVLQTVINNHPIRTRSTSYPPGSIRQIPGAFEQIRHRAAGRSVTLDEIEKTILPEFKEPRVHLALGRGAVGSGRLRSEAYTGDKIRAQLDAIQREFVSEASMLAIDRTSGQMAVTAIISWHEAEFIAAYDKGATGPFAERSPIERAILSFIMPNLYPLEREVVQKGTFRVVFQPFDWRLNDLTSGRD